MVFQPLSLVAGVVDDGCAARTGGARRQGCQGDAEVRHVEMLPLLIIATWIRLIR